MMTLRLFDCQVRKNMPRNCIHERNCHVSYVKYLLFDEFYATMFATMLYDSENRLDSYTVPAVLGLSNSGCCTKHVYREW